jgi:hypothetical protein
VEGQTVTPYRFWVEPKNLISVLLCVALASPVLAADRKVSREELVLRHLESIGSVEVLEGVPFLLAQGVCIGRGRIFSQAGSKSGSFRGVTEFATGPHSTLFSVVFESEHYRVEGFRYEASELDLFGFQPPQASGLSGTESSFGQLTTYVPRWEQYIKQGLWGGVLNALWPFLKPEEVLPKLESLKRKKVDQKELLVLEYDVAGSPGVELFFDPETHRHVASRSSRKEVVSTSWTGYWESLTLWEKFSDFAEFDGLQLPTSWTITLVLPRDTSHWEIAFDDIWRTKRPTIKHSAKR